MDITDLIRQYPLINAVAIGMGTGFGIYKGIDKLFDLFIAIKKNTADIPDLKNCINEQTDDIHDLRKILKEHDIDIKKEIDHLKKIKGG